MEISEEQVRALRTWANAKTTGFGPAFDGAFEVAKEVLDRPRRQTKAEAAMVVAEWLSAPRWKLQQIKKAVWLLLNSTEIEEVAVAESLDLRTRMGWCHLLGYARSSIGTGDGG